MVTKKWLTRCRIGALVICGFAPLLAREYVRAEPSLANLLNAPPPSDPLMQATDQLASQLADIERRPFARSAAVQHALAEARAALSHARAALTNGRPDEQIQQALLLARAALSAADRLEARAFAAASLARLKQQADDAESAARVAMVALDEASASGTAHETKP